MEKISLPFDETRCSTFLINEEQKHGCGGVLLVDGDKWAYVMPNTDVFPESFVTELGILMDDDRNAHFFIVLLKDSRLDVIKLKKEVAMLRVTEQQSKSSS